MKRIYKYLGYFFLNAAVFVLWILITDFILSTCLIRRLRSFPSMSLNIIKLIFFCSENSIKLTDQNNHQATSDCQKRPISSLKRFVLHYAHVSKCLLTDAIWSLIRDLFTFYSLVVILRFKSATWFYAYSPPKLYGSIR